MKQGIIVTALVFIFNSAQCQNYTSYFTGNVTDVVTQPQGGICLMGGASEHDEAMKWFLNQSNGGDILVIRASGSNGYNDYMYNQLGVSINSVETIVFNNASASYEPYILDKISKAEAIWIAGGDQWTYISYWRNTPIDSLINKGIHERNMVIGGTSAGMAIQGSYYFSAENGTVSSSQALSNPYNSLVTVSNDPFLINDYLTNVITDTHYDNPDRKGRHATFIARVAQDQQNSIRGIACNEYTAICIDSSGLCRVFGDYPNYPEHAYFIQANCEIPNNFPEICSNSTPLTWNQGGLALKVYKANGTNLGTQTFDLNDWKTGNGGTWEDWSIVNGVLIETTGVESPCSINANSIIDVSNGYALSPNPLSSDILTITGLQNETIEIYDAIGKKQPFTKQGSQINCAELENGVYYISIDGFTKQFVIFR